MKEVHRVLITAVRAVRHIIRDHREAQVHRIVVHQDRHRAVVQAVLVHLADNLI